VKSILSILVFSFSAITSLTGVAQTKQLLIQFDFYGDSVQLPLDPSSVINFDAPISEAAVQNFYQTISQSQYSPFLQQLLGYKTLYKLDDWLYFQLVRKTAQQISPKAANYDRYTLYKWFLLVKSGYDATLKLAGNRMLLYVQSNENIFEIPYYTKNGKQYVCLNYHDYGGNIDFAKETFKEVNITVPEATCAFSYKVTKMPNFKPNDYTEKELGFNYADNDYHFKIKTTPQIQNLFANYPVVDYESCFNIPLSKETYQSLIPALKKNIKGLNTKSGVDYLMRFTRYAFLFEKDTDQFGKEKRMTPEQTLLYKQSDCEDRVALFYYLVKEIYQLPMIVLVYPAHVTIAVKFDKPVGKPILYNGSQYSVCEPTPQALDLAVGQLLPNLQNQTFEVAFEYNPKRLNK
jgi:hypothetical protein